LDRIHQSSKAAAALFCLRRIVPYIEPCSTLTFNEDNQNVVAWQAKLNCPSAMSKGVICEISWLLACFNIELDVRYINTLQNKTADACSRWLSLSQLERKKFIADYKRHQPTSWADAGIVRHTAASPELFEKMDIWVLEDTCAELDWFPVALTR
jgi:hypothetical protein